MVEGAEGMRTAALVAALQRHLVTPDPQTWRNNRYRPVVERFAPLERASPGGYALRRTKAGQLSTLTYLAPVVAVVLGWVVLGERPPWLALAGGAVAIAGVFYARRSPAKVKPGAVSSA